MSAVRQDAWTPDDDLILAEVTLRHIREGGTQLAAFEEVGERIGRTSAACGFRWNSFVRKKYDAAIQIAKAQRQKRNQLKKHSPVNVNVSSVSAAVIERDDYQLNARQELLSEESLSVDAVIRFLRQWKQTYQEMNKQIKTLEKTVRDQEEDLQELRRQRDELHKQVNEVQTDYQVVNEDYKALIQIMDRARKLAFLAEEEEGSKPRFKMDANGNLERID